MTLVFGLLFNAPKNLGIVIVTQGVMCNYQQAICVVQMNDAVPGVRQQPVVCAKLRRVSRGGVVPMYYDIEVTIAQQTASTTKWAALKVWI